MPGHFFMGNGFFLRVIFRGLIFFRLPLSSGMLVLQRKDPTVSAPFAVSILRVVHFLLVLHAAAILGIVYFTGHAGTMPASERIFVFAVGIPMLLGSFSCWFAATVRGLFGTAIFFCSFLALALAALPMMANVFFPAHLALFSFAAVYGFSAIILAWYCFAQPPHKKK